MELSYFLAAGESPADAVPVAQEALRVLERRHTGDDRPVVTRALWALGNALSSVDRDAEAVPYLRRACDMVGRIYGRDGAKFMRSLQLLGVAELSSGDLPAAREHLGLAAQRVEAAAPDHPLAPLVHMYYAIALLRDGDAKRAEALSVRASAEAAKAGRNDVADRAVVVLARARSLLGREAEAIATVDAALPGLRERRSDKLSLALAAKAGAQRRSGALADAVRTIADAVAQAGELRPGGRVELLLEQARIALANADGAQAAACAGEAKRLLVASGAQRAPEFAEAERLGAAP
jgi:serine/threonine-protein kinase